MMIEGSVDNNSISSTSENEGIHHGASTKRDEIQEVKKLSAKETDIIRRWRVLVCTCLFVAGVVITITAHHFLKVKEIDKFELAFGQFARTLCAAAIDQQRYIRESFRGLADSIAAYTNTTKILWPFVTIPNFETLAKHYRLRSGAEIISTFVYVEEPQRLQYLNYTVSNHEAMVAEAHQNNRGSLDRLKPQGFKPYIWKEPVNFTAQDTHDSYFLSWHFSPPPSTYGFLNFDCLAVDDYDGAWRALSTLRNQTVITAVRKYVALSTAITFEEHQAMHSALPNADAEYPHSIAWYPVHDKLDDPASKIVLLLAFGIAWDFTMRKLVPEGIRGLVAVVSNSCGQSFTYEVDGHEAFFLGARDMHDPSYNSLAITVSLSLNSHRDFDSTPGHCLYNITVYPSTTFKDLYVTKTPEIFAGIIMLSFVVIILIFLIYDMQVQRRNEKVIYTTAKSNQIITSVFPGAIRDRLVQPEEEQADSDGERKSLDLSAYLAAGGGRLDRNSKPLAELFLETTVAFADIVGFTAWSSVREPFQVFLLLETLFHEFDKVASQRGVYKVETVGDCYVAVAGLPLPRKDHAVVMIRFARDIIRVMPSIKKHIERTLGPGAGDLAIRVGVHSGPVTAGVLRGERARFQLFGDTMNTCARLESTGVGGRVHLSKETADLLIKAGKGSWVSPRGEPIYAKGKGELVTYFLRQGGSTDNSNQCSSSRSSDDFSSQSDESMLLNQETNLDNDDDLVDWNVRALVEILRQIMARQEGHEAIDKVDLSPIHFPGSTVGMTPFDEVKEIIFLPSFNDQASRKQRNSSNVVVPNEVMIQIRDYVSCIARMYRRNPFHNFEHASHVVMSVTKLLSRIIAPSDLHFSDDDGVIAPASTLHDHTYGITSDPLTQFACAFAALIHDVDHTGVPNTQLIIENPKLAGLYSNRSVAEQNSLDLAWDLFLDKRYEQFRCVLCPTLEELIRFRQLVVNCVMATDIMDKDLKTLRNERWTRAFNEEQPCSSTVEENVNRKATIVIEHIIQASDVAHTMQHWHVYRKWNEKLFRELYLAFQTGRAARNPAEFWYEGELGFFDFYIIPLAKKLKDCGVFGISSDEYLSYAMSNRKEWQSRGKEMIAKMVESLEST